MILRLERREGGIFRVNLERLELLSKMTRSPSLQFFTQTLRVSDVRKASRFNLNGVFNDPYSKEYLSRVCFHLSAQVRNDFQITHLPSGFYELPITNGGTQYLSHKASAASVVSLELHYHDNQYLMLNFHGARKSTTPLEVCWMKKGKSVYNNWLDYLDVPSTIIYSNQCVTHPLTGHQIERDASLTVGLTRPDLAGEPSDHFWEIYVYSHADPSGNLHTGIRHFSKGLPGASKNADST